jgi:hypothetical protein
MTFLMIQAIAGIAVHQGIVTIIETGRQIRIVHGKVIVVLLIVAGVVVGIVMLLLSVGWEKQRSVTAIHSTVTKTARGLFLIIIFIIIIFVYLFRGGGLIGCVFCVLGHQWLCLCDALRLRHQFLDDLFLGFFRVLWLAAQCFPFFELREWNGVGIIIGIVVLVPCVFVKQKYSKTNTHTFSFELVNMQSISSSRIPTKQNETKRSFATHFLGFWE